MRPDQTPATGPADKAAELAHHPRRVAPIELGLRPAHDAPATARAAVSAGLAAHLGEVVLADALLLVAELVTNSGRHAQAPADAVITVRAELRADVLRVEVVDSGTGGAVARRTPDLHNGGGFGLNLVETLSARWGVDRNRGTRVWAELARPRTAARQTTIDDGAAREHDQPDRGRPDAAALTARAQAANRQAAAACEAAARAQENARRAHHRCTELRAQSARGGQGRHNAPHRVKAA